MHLIQLSRDLSPTGLRLIGTRSLLGHKVSVLLPRGPAMPPLSLQMRVLWTGMIGEDLFENGGVFVEMADDGAKEPDA